MSFRQIKDLFDYLQKKKKKTRNSTIKTNNFGMKEMHTAVYRSTHLKLLFFPRMFVL